MHAKLSLAFLALSGAALSSAQALYSTSFEAPAYTAGASVVGTDGWVTGSSEADPTRISSTLASAGSQALRFDNAANTPWFAVGHALPAATASGPFSVSVDLYMSTATAASRTYELALMSTTTGSMSTSTVSFGMSIGGNGRIRAGKAWSSLYNTNTFVATATAGSFADRWLNIKLDVDASRNGVATLSGFGDGKSYTYSFTGIGSTAGLNLVSDNTGAFGGAGTGTFDNLVVARPVPEPMTLTALGCGLAALARRRRKV